MTKDELINKLGDIEWEDFEVKKAKASIPKSAWDTVSGFSNSNGGWLIFGVEQQGKYFEITGVQNAEKIEQDFLTTIRGGKFNAMIETVQELYHFDDKKVLAFYIKGSPKKPIYFGNPINTFIRRGSADMRATKEEVDSMYRNQTFGTKTSETIVSTSIRDLKIKSIDEYRDYMSRFNPSVKYNKLSQNDFLTRLRIIEDDKCTYSGLLMFGKREIIERNFPDFWIDLLEIPGTSYSDAKTRYTFRLDEYENLWEYYFECFARLKQRVNIDFSINDQGFGQEQSPGLIAIREVLVNMLIHADYFSPSHPRIRIFTNSIEFYNPGGFPKPMEEIKNKDISLPRNPILTKFFRMIKLAENAGYGIDKIESNWIEYNNTKPTYITEFDSTIVSLSLIEDVEKDVEKDVERDVEKDRNRDLSKNEQIIVREIEKDAKISAAKLSVVLGINTRNTQKTLDKLKTKGIIERIGADKGGYWEIKK